MSWQQWLFIDLNQVYIQVTSGQMSKQIPGNMAPDSGQLTFIKKSPPDYFCKKTGIILFSDSRDVIWRIKGVLNYSSCQRYPLMTKACTAKCCRWVFSPGVLVTIVLSGGSPVHWSGVSPLNISAQLSQCVIAVYIFPSSDNTQGWLQTSYWGYFITQWNNK